MILWQQSALDPGGPQASRILTLAWWFLGLCTAVFAAVIATLLAALLRKPRGTEQPSPDAEDRMAHIVIGASAVTIVILFALVVASVATGSSLARLGTSRKAGVLIELTGQQWWWQARYLNDDPSLIVTTANELHVPTGVPVEIRGLSTDVIHSFWVPSLHGKRDLIPSRVSSEWIQADRPGRYRGQCAEFCGLQHAHMAIWIVADSPAQYHDWMAAQLQPSREPETGNEKRGLRVFLDSGCVLCHAIQGTDARATAGPDLTHLASRGTLAAGALINNRKNLGEWIADPQNIKPGNHMATIPLRGEDRETLLDYLESLR